MNMYDSLFLQNSMLSEQIARQVFETIPEEGPLVIIMDTDGNCRSSNSEKFEHLSLSRTWIETFCSKICDGVEPVVSYIQNHGIIGIQLATEHAKYGYILIAIENQQPEATLAKIEFIETILNQYNAIARLIEENNSYYQTQTKFCSAIHSN